MGRAMIVAVALALAVYCLVQVLQSRGQHVRLLPRWAWLLVILLLPIIGPIGWLWLGRPRQGRPPTRPQPRTIAPDDDPDFLRGLNWNLRRDPKKDE